MVTCDGGCESTRAFLLFRLVTMKRVSGPSGPETGFVHSLVHTRALTVIVDGLNEVSADTREKIGGFAQDTMDNSTKTGWSPPSSVIGHGDAPR